MGWEGGSSVEQNTVFVAMDKPTKRENEQRGSARDWKPSQGKETGGHKVETTAQQ